MITKEQYELLKKNYGSVASWAIWKSPGATDRNDIGDVSIFDDENILVQLNSKYVFVGLNGSGAHDDYMDKTRPWHNFHSSKSSGYDYKLRFALSGTEYWGSYITDIIKDFPEGDSKNVEEYCKLHPDYLKAQLECFEKEISILGKPVLIALGGACYRYLHTYLRGKYKIYKIIHYSYRYGYQTVQSYRERVLNDLNNISNGNIPYAPKEEFQATMSTKSGKSKTISDNNFGKRQNEIKEYFAERGINYIGQSPRDIHFKENGRHVSITDQGINFAIYAYAEDSEKDFYLKTFEKLGAIKDSINREPEKSNTKKCCARWEHTNNDYELMHEIVTTLLGI